MNLVIKIGTLLLLVSGVFAEANPCAGIKLGFVNDYAGCSKYFSCVNEIAFPVECENGFYFDAVNLLCVPPGSIECAVCPDIGIISVRLPGSCTLYTLCINGEPFERSCGPGTMFDPITSQCNLSELVDCEEDTCPPTGNAVAPDPRSCSHYFICSEGETIARRECAENLLFDQHLLACTRAELASCFTG